ncbi:predicted protein [Chaetomium globosum CBS 148.51]|uniref:Uncharacterized protein n=1 Tax=Chaetomium globosum (strain ATCC 6205 / CBS 148.51 / DSM 1962 / NBRC 6347 / NRRL 1970) TaxID=306901 RepID=Q2HHZ8_CHAGB|nr:uncharacterized protein CHGG_00156 [Chaetomium globosum CBS 148.51]EAQ91921.1 predicted protein [Chaetomium globosum CBS 148.51]
MLLPSVSSSFRVLNLLALLLVPLSQPVNALPTPQADKECSTDPCAVVKDWPMTPYCYEGHQRTHADVFPSDTAPLLPEHGPTPGSGYGPAFGVMSPSPPAALAS